MQTGVAVAFLTLISAFHAGAQDGTGPVGAVNPVDAVDPVDPGYNAVNPVDAEDPISPGYSNSGYSMRGTGQKKDAGAELSKLRLQLSFVLVSGTFRIEPIRDEDWNRAGVPVAGWCSVCWSRVRLAR